MPNTKTKDEVEHCKAIAKDLWLYSPYTQNEIAEKVGISAQVIIQWRRKYGWDELKDKLLQATDKRIANYMKLLDLFTDKLQADNVDVDELTKLNALVEKNSVKGTEPSHLEKVGLLIIKYLDEFMPEKRDHYINFYRAFAEWYTQKRW